jgi:hypothetical protein
MNSARRSSSFRTSSGSMVSLSPFVFQRQILKVTNLSKTVCSLQLSFFYYKAPSHSLLCKCQRHYTAKYQKFETNISRKGIARPQSQFSPFICLWAINIFPRSICLFCCRKYVNRSWEYINRSQTHECGNWDWGRAIPRKGIHKWDFCCSV